MGFKKTPEEVFIAITDDDEPSEFICVSGSTVDDLRCEIGFGSVCLGGNSHQ
jgi:hypothetical protein